MTRITPAEPPVVLYAGQDAQRDAYAEALKKAAGRARLDIKLVMEPEGSEPEKVDYMLFARGGPVDDFAPYTGLKAILSLWAGVDSILGCEPPEDVPLCRMVEDGLTLGMIDYVSGHVLRHHLDIDRHLANGPNVAWEKNYPPLARDRRVGVLGLGSIGGAAARALAEHGFRVAGWSRSEKSMPGIFCFHGEEGLGELLEKAEILVLLLPHTAETERLINADRLAKLPKGAILINAGRGPLIDHDALIEALDRGHIAHATMDVFDVEPLPEDHPYWTHEKVTVTPHIASVTRPQTASEAVIAQIARAERGEPLLHVVDRDLGY